MHSNIRIIPSVDHFFIDRYGSRELWNMRLEISNLIDSLVANLISFAYNLHIHTESGASLTNLLTEQGGLRKHM